MKHIKTSSNSNCLKSFSCSRFSVCHSAQYSRCSRSPRLLRHSTQSTCKKIHISNGIIFTSLLLSRKNKFARSIQNRTFYVATKSDSSLCFLIALFFLLLLVFVDFFLVIIVVIIIYFRFLRWWL